MALRYARRVNSLTELFITKLDVLSGFETIKAATGYTSGGKVYAEFPRQQRVLYRCAPVYEEMEGWSEDISEARAFGDLPGAARRYIEFIEDQAGVPVGWVSVGPEREQVVSRQAE